MPESQRFPYVEIDPSLGAASALPYAPITLQLDGIVASVSALVDSGAALSVLPYDVGIQLGAVWEQQTIPVQLAGNLADSDARGTRDGIHRSIRARSSRFRMDSQQSRSDNPRAGQLLHGIRCLLLPVAIGIRNQTKGIKLKLKTIRCLTRIWPFESRARNGHSS